MPAKRASYRRRLQWHLSGKPAKEIAESEGLSLRTVQLELARVRREIAELKDRIRVKGPHLELMFGCQPYTPQITCKQIHPRGAIKQDGSHCCCASCHRTGIENHPMLRR